ncbi:hypothetical protein ONB67_00305 [Candidatus Vidania fulgoroideae]|uniref:Translation initiation factor 3 C-terminal domain-containing protein n=1 Tax=Candidatus Vidania fulgoroideorum TaxID=881286 RepID=A0AAX3N8E0_9PROT|nr:hypothetical protein ONB67_00305 [Candidatus Vidania fulgoroideae]
MNVKLIIEGKISITKYSEALEIAKKKGANLVFIKDKMYKLVFFKKLVYKKKKFKKSINKEIKFSFNISNNDIKTKIKKIEKFIKKKNNIKISIFLKGREILKTKLIMEIVNKIKKNLTKNRISYTNLKKNNNVYFFNINYKK